MESESDLRDDEHSSHFNNLFETHDCTRYNSRLAGDMLTNIIGFLQDNPDA